MEIKAASLKVAGPMDLVGRAGLAAGAGGAGYLAATHPALQGFRDTVAPVAGQGMDALHRAGDFYQGLGHQGLEALQPAIANAQANTQQVVDAAPGVLHSAGDFYSRLGQQVMDLLHQGGHQAMGAVGL